MGFYFLITYAIGYFISLLILTQFGKTWGLDYSNEDRDPDDWENNASAYAGISCAWPMLLVFGIAYCFWQGLVRLSQFLINLNGTEEVKD